MNPQQNNRRGDQPQQPQQPQQPAAENGNQPAEGATPPPTSPATNNDNQQSLLAVTWMIFTSFFASLIPDTN